ncbi:hypothetical protein [Bordetella sp. LUAb4]|uniref:hypothetical protein n=1 Tax=Bordetella sp. LUAb4 TaxID=2843195 RepID=UPI001E59941A|nr:hypothetical protein [Bordetella sp. LUAb4]
MSKNIANDMAKAGMAHVDDKNADRSAQPVETEPPRDSNPDKYTNSGYPGGGDKTQPDKDEYGRDPAQQKQAELTPQEAVQRKSTDRLGESE